MTVQEAIDYIAQTHGLTLPEIAVVLRVSERTLQRWVKGRDRPTQEHIDRLELLIEKGAEVANALDNIYIDIMKVSGSESQEEADKSESEGESE